MDSLNKNMDSFAARCFQGSFKQYFEVDQKYVLKKIGFFFFPFLEFNKVETQPSDQFGDQENSQDPAISQKSVLDCDLYIPLMSFSSYILLTCLFLGLASQ